MNRIQIYEKAAKVFCDVFDDETLAISDTTTSSDIEEWDSLSNLVLICELELAFGIKFSMEELMDIKNVGELVDIIENHTESGL